MVGAVGELEFASSTVQVESYGLLSLYSDGAFELERPDGMAWAFGDFIEFMEKVPRTPEQTGMDGLIRFANEFKGVDEFVDDLSMVEFLFPPAG
jgi:sigma-B regulation protein RsbU (phosphoserine phosphatase)